MNTRLHGLSLLASLFLVLMAVAVTMGVPFYFCIRLGGLLLISTFMVGLVTALVKEAFPGPGRGTSASRYYYEQQVQAIRRLHFDSTGSFHGPTLHDMHRIVQHHHKNSHQNTKIHPTIQTNTQRFPL
jgi:hypothetical protein